MTLESSFPSNPLVANVDADLLKQAALNVIQNGAQAMPHGGRLRVVLEENKKSAVLRIADEGTGIPDEIREKIFDLYFTTKSEGSGIGLAMTYRILQLHHGSVEVQSNVDRGTEFILRIPLAAADWGRRHLQPAIMGNSEGFIGMRTPVKSVAWLLPFMLTACFIHKPHQAAQTQPWAPTIGDDAPPKPEAAAPDLPLQALTIPSVTTTDASAPQMPPEQPAKRKVRHKKPANKNVEEASNDNERGQRHRSALSRRSQRSTAQDQQLDCFHGT